jgi:hypothetical protein
VIALPSRQDAMAILCLIRSLAPQAIKIVRSRHQIHRDEFLNAGADFVLGDEEEMSKAMSQLVLRQYREMFPSVE